MEASTSAGVLLRRCRAAPTTSVAEERVVVEVHLGVEHAQLAGLGDDQRVDLEQAHVLLDEGP